MLGAGRAHPASRRGHCRRRDGQRQHCGDGDGLQAACAQKYVNPRSTSAEWAASFEKRERGFVNRSTAAFCRGSGSSRWWPPPRWTRAFQRRGIHSALSGSITLAAKTPIAAVAKSIAHGEVDMQKALADSRNRYFAAALGQRLRGEAIRSAAVSARAFSRQRGGRHAHHRIGRLTQRPAFCRTGAKLPTSASAWAPLSRPRRCR